MRKHCEGSSPVVKSLLGLFLSVGLLAALYAGNQNQNSSNQNNPQNTQPNTQNSVQGRDQASGLRHEDQGGQSLDHCLATILTLENENEIHAAQLAVQRASDNRVKEFANQMIQDHQAFLDKLRPHADQSRNSSDVNSDRNRNNADKGNSRDRSAGNQENTPQDNNRKNADQIDANQNENRQNSNDANKQDANQDKGTNNQDINRTDARRNQVKPGDSTTTSGPPSTEANQSGSFKSQLNQIHQELAQQCRKSDEQELSSKSGAEFDKCYMGMQLAKHIAMLDKLTVFERHTSPELRQQLAEGRQTTQKHLDHAKSLMDSIKDRKDSSSTATLEQSNEKK